MRSDLTPAFIAAMSGSFRKPRQLLVFHFPKAGDIYISDQPLGAADGLDNEYQPLVENWGELQDSVGDVKRVDNAEIRQASITLWNGGKKPFSDYFLQEYPENVEVELFQWFVGLADADKARLERFSIQDPIEFSEASRLLNLDLVSLSIRWDQPVGELLTKEDWPKALDSDIGKGIPQAFGTTGQIPSLVAKAPMVLRLKGSILANSMTIEVYEDLDDLSFPTSGTVVIEEEKIRYNGRTSHSLSVLQRGYLSDADLHLDKREVAQVITDHTFFLCAGPVAVIDKVMIEGFPAPENIYTVYPYLDPARIVFSEKPWVKKFAEATRFLEMQFDSVGGANTALQAPYAFDADQATNAARILPGNNTLALTQNTKNPNRGEILKAYLVVDHWESGNFLSDYAEVWVSGIGVIGRLSRPPEYDKIVLDADVNLKHEHKHETGGVHGHESSDPVFQSTSDPHAHAYDGDEQSVAGSVSTSEQVAGISVPFGPFKSNFTRAFVRWRYTGGPYTVYWGMFENEYSDVYIGGVGGHDTSAIYESWITNDSYIKSTSIVPRNTMRSAHFKILSVTVYYSLVDNKTSPTQVITDTDKKTVGQVRDNLSPVKGEDDVVPLGDDRVALDINSQDNPTRSIRNIFDLTEYVSFNWGWFTNREVRIIYKDTDTGEGKTVQIPHMFFDVEFVPTEIIFSDKITANVIAPANRSRPDQAIQFLLTQKADVGREEFDTDSFTAIAAKYISRGYSLGGLIPAFSTVREAIKTICLQTHSRFFTSGGMLKMVLREGHPASKPVAASLTQDNTQWRSVSVSRQPMREISNRIQLFFKRDWLAGESDTSGYLDSVTKEDSDSIAKFGLKTRQDGFNFDLIRDASMAEAVVDFYLMTDAYPSSFYTFIAYLDQMMLEKEDVIQLSANFNKMRKVPMVIKAMDRIFGSAKNQSINHLRIVAENLWYLLIEMSLEDQVTVMDTLTILIYEVGHFEEAVHVIEQLMSKLTVRRDDAVLLSESLMNIIDWKKELSEKIAVDDAIRNDLESMLEDAVVMDDFLTFYSVYGFGSGGFGQVPFGGTTTYKQKHPDKFFIFMQLAMVISAVREDSVMISDKLMMTSGFGGELGSGFGKSPFGR